MPGEHILRRDLADRTVQADVVVMLDVPLQQVPCIESSSNPKWF
jgi:hypothetical protein